MPLHEHGIPRRITYLIDPEGVIRKTYDMDQRQEELAEHAAELLADIQAMS